MESVIHTVEKRRGEKRRDEKYVHKDTGQNRPSSWVVNQQMEIMNEPDITKAAK